MNETAPIEATVIVGLTVAEIVVFAVTALAESGAATPAIATKPTAAMRNLFDVRDIMGLPFVSSFVLN
jgi:hypothetical protein